MGTTKTQRRGLPADHGLSLVTGGAATARQEDVYVRPVAPVEHAASTALSAALARPVAALEAERLRAEVAALRERVADLESELSTAQRAMVAMEADTRTAVAAAVRATEHRILGEQRYAQFRAHKMTSILEPGS